MDLTPGSTARDSRSLSAEAAQYGAQASDAESELRQLEARMKTIREKAEQARLAKQQTEAAREEAFQTERQDRQAVVRHSINDHILEGLRRKIACKPEPRRHMGILERLVAGQAAENDEITWFHGVFMEELTGDDQDFVRSLASRLLQEPEPVAASENRQAAQSQGFKTGSKYHDLATKLPISPTPANNPLQSPTSQYLPRSPETSHDRYESPEVAIKNIATVNESAKGALQELITQEDRSVIEARFSTDEDILENIGTINGGYAQYNLNCDADEQEHEFVSNDKIVSATNAHDVIDLSGDDGALVEYDFVIDNQEIHTNTESTKLDQTDDSIGGVEYNTVEQEDVFAYDDKTPMIPRPQPPDADTLRYLSSLPKSEQKNWDTKKSVWADLPGTITSNRRQSTTSNDSGLTVPLTPQPATTSLNKVVIGTPNATSISKKPPGKRKRQESEIGESVVSVVVTPVNKKGKTKATDTGESTESPASKKGKSKPKDESSVPARVQAFINNTKKLSPEDRARALICSSCEQLPRPARISNCNHMYCETCWKVLMKSATGKKPSEVPCDLDNCTGHLGRATIVAADLDILNLQSEVWTGVKSKGTGKNQANGNARPGDGVEGKGDALEVEVDMEDTIDVQ